MTKSLKKNQKKTKKTRPKSASPLSTSSTSSANTQIKHRGAMPPLAQNHPRKPQASQKINPTNSKTMTPTPTRNQKKTQKKNRKRTQKTPSKSSQPLFPLAQPQKIIRKLTVSKRPPLAQSHPRKPLRETLFAAKIRMTGRPLTAPIAPPCPDLQGVHPRNRPLLKNRSPTPTAAYGTNAPAIRIRRSRSQMPRAASRTKST